MGGKIQLYLSMSKKKETDNQMKNPFKKGKVFTASGLMLNFIGAVLLAFSIEIIQPGEGIGKVEIFGGTVTITTINVCLFYPGISCLILGFTFQIIDLFQEQRISRSIP